MRRRRVLPLLGALAAAAAGQASRPAPAWEHPGPVAAHRVCDVDGDGCADLVVIEAAGLVWTYRGGRTGLAREARGGWRLPDPARTLLSLGNLEGGKGPPGLVAVSPRGLSLHGPGPDGVLAPDETLLPLAEPFPFRVGRPLFAEFLQDVDQDGRPDLVLPRRDACDLWLNRAGEGGRFRLERTATVAVKMRHERRAAAWRLSDVLVSSFSVPRLQIQDVNGDGRLDLAVEEGQTRAFHLQAENGALPARPDATVDLDLFRDTTPRGAVRLGRTLAGTDRTQFLPADLDGDGILDYVLAHRRKIWAFLGTPKGPQFTEPAVVLKTAEDITYLLLARVDGDDRPDLVIFKVQVPSLGALLAAFVAEWDLEIALAGYAAAGGGRFATSPTWRRELAVRLPNLSSVLRDPGRWLERLEETGSRFRPEFAADGDGDGRPDLALMTEDRRRLELWRGRDDQERQPLAERDRLVRELLLGEGGAVWTVDRILETLGAAAARRLSWLTGDRAPDLTIALPDPAEVVLADLQPGDFDGDGRAEVLLAGWRVGAVERTVFAVVPLR